MKVSARQAFCLLFVPAVTQSIEAESFEYRRITSSDLKKVQADWASRDLSAQGVKIIEEGEIDGGRLMIVRHDVASRAHFGAIIIPDVDDLTTVPVVVLPDHLEQNNPTFDLQANIEKYRSFEPIDGFVQILPAFRGRFMGYKNNGWFSRGDFCDAWDGPTDDSIALLNAAEQLLPEVNFEEVLVWGGSRGGNTAFLMAARDPRVHTVIAIAAPVDFYRESWQIEGTNQYRCQFFDGRDHEEARQQMLASSPLFFEPTESLERVTIHHDEGDDIVPLWNAQEMSAHLKSHSVNVTTHIYPTTAHGHLVAEDSFWENMRETISEFVSRAGDGR